MRLALTLPLAAMAVAGTVAAATGPTSAPVSPPATFDAEQQVDCTQLYPSRTSVAGVTDHGKRVSLDVVVVLDGVSRQVADERLAHAARAYEPLGIDLVVTRHVDGLQRRDATGALIERTSDVGRESQAMIDFAKAQFGGRRPADADIVYVLTDLDIHARGIGNSVAGQADCIGGIAWDDTAFAVGEVGDEVRLGLVSYQHEFTSKVFAHELGHLMGAHHHYQECGRPAVAEAAEGGLGPCSLMSNFVDLQAIDFSTMSGLVVRAHAVDFAD